MAAQKSEEKPTSEIVKNGVKLIGERFLPGASLLMDGKIVQGGAHALIGFGAKAIFGLPGLVALAANSFSQSVTGKGILSHIGEMLTDTDTAQEVKK